MARRVRLIEGSSIDTGVVCEVQRQIPRKASVMVVLDSDHSRDHVLAELRSYGPMVTEGCYMVVADTRLGRLKASQTPRKRSKIWHRGNEPLSALEIYLRETDRFEVNPVMTGKQSMGSSPGGYLLCGRNA
jgi:cephalosporin hydroxylase